MIYQIEHSSVIIFLQKPVFPLLLLVGDNPWSSSEKGLSLFLCHVVDMFQFLSLLLQSEGKVIRVEIFTKISVL